MGIANGAEKLDAKNENEYVAGSRFLALLLSAELALDGLCKLAQALADMHGLGGRLNLLSAHE